MADIGMVLVETGESVGQEESAQNHANYMSTKDVSKIAKTILKITTMMGLGSNGATAMEQNNQQCKMDVQWTTAAAVKRFGFGSPFFFSVYYMASLRSDSMETLEKNQSED